MKTQQEIEERLSLVKKESEEIDDWCKKAQQIYATNRSFFGQADNGEYITAQEALLSVRNEITLLRWVLNI